MDDDRSFRVDPRRRPAGQLRRPVPGRPRRHRCWRSEEGLGLVRCRRSGHLAAPSHSHTGENYAGGARHRLQGQRQRRRSAASATTRTPTSAAVEPFHGNTLALYTRDGARDGRRRRHLGTPGAGGLRRAATSAGEGPAHHVVCADFDGDGDDELLVALRGPMPHQGVFLYKSDRRAPAARSMKTRLSERVGGPHRRG